MWLELNWYGLIRIGIWIPNSYYSALSSGGSRTSKNKYVRGVNLPYKRTCDHLFFQFKSEHEYFSQYLLKKGNFSKLHAPIVSFELKITFFSELHKPNCAKQCLKWQAFLYNFSKKTLLLLPYIPTITGGGEGIQHEKFLQLKFWPVLYNIE